MYISDIIGDEYKEWNPEAKVFISTPTGTGKTTFITKVLFPYAVSRGLKIAYLVNRTALDKHLHKEINGVICERWKNPNAKQYITIMTYQALEEKVKQNPQYDVLGDYAYIICDEAHYFLKDSLFNTNTCFSYKHVLDHYGKAILVFMSATIDKMQREICGENNVGEDYSTEYRRKAMNTRNFYYVSEKNYHYVDIKSFKDKNEIPEIILKQGINDKWWIFINDIKYGKKLEKILKKDNVDALFVDSKYDENVEERSTVSYLINSQLMKHRVIIATSVLDNGISVHDEELRKMIILAESEEDFIQMLGRKRLDGKSVCLYLCLQDKAHFERRLCTLKQTYSVYSGVKKYVNFPQKIFDSLLVSPFYYKHARKFLCTYTERVNIINGQQIGMQEIFGVGINFLSIRELLHQIAFYQTEIEKMNQTGDYAFLDTQLEWLGKSRAAAEEIVVENKEEEIVRNKKEVEAILKKYLFAPFDDVTNKKMKTEIRGSLRRLIELCAPDDIDIEKLDNSIRKLDINLSANKFNECMRLVGLNYSMSGGNGKKFTITKDMEESE